MKETTKRCRKCESMALIGFTSLNMKRCADCGHEMPWLLEPGQKPLIGPSRTMKKES